MNTLVFPRGRFEQEYRALRSPARGPAGFSTMAVGRASGPGGIQILVPPVGTGSPDGLSGTLRFGLSASLVNEWPDRLLADEIDAALVLGQGPGLGQARGFVRGAGGTMEPVGELILPGPPGLLKVNLLAPAPGDARRGPEIFSRVAGALSEPVFRGLRQIRFALVGAGRLGGCLATILARDGASRFTLIDPDQYEPHNGGGGLVGSPSDAGKWKVSVLGRALREMDPAIEVVEQPHSVTHLNVLSAVMDCDLIVTATDHDSARLAAALLAVCHLKPLLDVGSGVWRRDGRREMGADVRLVGPGRCLLCAGGLRAEDAARRVLASAEAERRLRTTPRDWASERAGSLASLNAAAAGIAARVVEDFVAGRIAENGFWSRVVFNEHGRVEISFPAAASRGTEPCACAWAALGDAGLTALSGHLGAAR